MNATLHVLAGVGNRMKRRNDGSEHWARAVTIAPPPVATRHREKWPSTMWLKAVISPVTIRHP